MNRLGIEIWSDIACPWCYVGKRRLEAALRAFPHRDAVDLSWRSFELDPMAPRFREGSASYAQRLATKYRTSVASAEKMIERMTETGATEGLELRFDRIRAGNTFDAHRLLHFASARGKGDVAKERLLRAYFTDGEAISDRDTLARLAGEIDLDRAEARTALDGDSYTREVRIDEADAAQLGIHGVPFFVFDRRYAVSGAQPHDALLHVLNKTWSDRSEATVTTDGAACGPEGC